MAEWGEFDFTLKPNNIFKDFSETSQLGTIVVTHSHPTSEVCNSNPDPMCKSW